MTFLIFDSFLDGGDVFGLEVFLVFLAVEFALVAAGMYTCVVIYYEVFLLVVVVVCTFLK